MTMCMCDARRRLSTRSQKKFGCAAERGKKCAAVSKVTRGMQAGDVVRCSQDFMTIMGDVTDPQEFGFAAFTAGPPLQEVSERARALCRCDPNDAVASLTIASGNENSFVIEGAHALGTIQQKNVGDRLWILALSFVIIAIAIVVLFKCK